MIWALDLDDFTNSCGQGSYPLLTVISEVLGNEIPTTTHGYLIYWKCIKSYDLLTCRYLLKEKFIFI